MHCFIFLLAIIKFYPECTVEYVNDIVCWFFMCRRSEGVLSLSIGHSSWQHMFLYHQSFQEGEGRKGMGRSCGAPVEKLISSPPPIKTCFILLSLKTVVPNVSTTSRPHETGIWNSSFSPDFGFPSSASVLWPDYGADTRFALAVPSVWRPGAEPCSSYYWNGSLNVVFLVWCPGS